MPPDPTLAVDLGGTQMRSALVSEEGVPNGPQVNSQKGLVVYVPSHYDWL